MRRIRIGVVWLALIFIASLGAAQLPAATPPSAPWGKGEILWDTFGVPHVFAETEAGAFYGFGYAQAQNHGNVVIRLYGEARGRAAEYWGAKFIASDKYVLANDVPERAQVWFKAQTPQMRANLDAFAAGVNAYAAAHKDKLDPSVLQVLPLSGIDILAHAHRLMNYQYVAPEQRVLSDRAPGGEGEPDMGGSNGWAVAPARSASGNTLLLANPHLPWEPSQLTYMEAHLNAPGLSVYGATQIGLPVLRFAFNNDLGFTNTVNSIRGFTTYVLTLSGDGYMFDGKVLPFEVKTKTYKVRQADGALKTETLRQRYTVHGPVFEMPDGKTTVAVKVAGLDRPKGLQQYLDMGKAHSWAEFETAMRTLQVPSFNIIYGDRAGHVFHIFNGHLPKYGTGDYDTWARPVPGDTSKTLWTETHGFDDLPKTLDPPGGFVQNANDPPWVSTWPRVLDRREFPAYAAPAGPMSQRAQMSVKLLSRPGKITFEDFISRKVETRSLMAERMLPDLLKAAAGNTDADVKQAVSILSSWDRRFEPEARGALLFETWAGIFAGPAFSTQANYALQWSPDDPIETPRGLKDPKAAIDMLKQAVTKAKQQFGAPDRPYGEVSRFHIGDVDLPGNGGAGNLGLFRTITWSPLQNGERVPVHGETWMSLVEFSTPIKAMGLMSYGSSSQPGTKHRNDQLKFLSSKTFRTLWTTRADVEKNLEDRTVF